MLKDILEERKLSVYALAKESGIPYSTLSDLLYGKTSMENVSASVLYKLAQTLDMSMEELYLGTVKEKVLYLYNVSRTVHIECEDIKLQYLGPKNLVSFKNIRKLSRGCIYVDTYFEEEDGTIYLEEDYIDLEDLLEEFHYDTSILSKVRIKIGPPSKSRRDCLIDESLLVSDHMAILLEDNSTEDIQLVIINVARPSSKMILRMRDYSILSTNMGSVMQKRAVDSVKRNYQLIMTEVERRRMNA